MFLLACAVVVIASGLYVLAPLFREPKGNLEAELLAETELDRLLNRKAVIYTNIKDLEFEYNLGRLSDADFQRLDAGYKAEADQILQKLDQLGVEKDVDEKIETEVAARRARLFTASPGPQSTGTDTCPSCGSATIPGKNFCADCGQQLV